MLAPLLNMVALTLVSRSSEESTGTTPSSSWGPISGRSSPDNLLGRVPDPGVQRARQAHLRPALGVRRLRGRHGLVNLVLSLIPLLLILVVTGFPLYATWAFLPVAVFITMLFSAGVSLLLFTFASRFSDVREMYIVIVQTWFFLTPIVYHPSIVPAKYRLVLWLNPLYYLVQIFRKPIYDGVLPSPRILDSLSISLVILVTGWVYFCHRADAWPTGLDRMSVIRLEKVSLRYRIPRERIGSFKEYAIRRIKRRLFFDEFEALRGSSFGGGGERSASSDETAPARARSCGSSRG